jgi:hypothetical protein
MRIRLPKLLWRKIFANTILIAIFFPILVLMLFVIAAITYTYHEEHAVDGFCEEVTDRDTPHGIIARATERKLFYAEWQGSEDIWVLNKPLEAPPMFRFACVVKFSGGKMSGKSVIDAD